MRKLEMKSHESDKKNLRYTKFCVGFFCTLFGVLTIFLWPKLSDFLLFNQLQLRPGTIYHKFWSEPPQPIYMDIYFFNWTNPGDITNKSSKPIFNEIGPFRFLEYPQKVNVTWHDHNHTVSYRKQSRYMFVPEQSKGSLEDVITSVNVIALSSAVQTRGWNLFKVKGIEISLNIFGQKIYTTRTVNEWLFEGYYDPIIPTASKIASLIGVGDIPFDRFGWFYQRNESSLLTGDFNVNTGVDDIRKVDQLRKWNYESSTKFFESECSGLGGSGGEFFPPGLPKDLISIFSPEMCRSVILEYEQDRDIHGVNTHKFTGGDKTLDNGTIYPENKCYCSGDCVPSGLFNVSACRFGAPVFMSFPHFYNADPFYSKQVEGMKPEKDKHEFFIALEPKTSFPLEIAARFQLNLLIDPIPRLNMYKDVPRLFMPVLWFEQHVKASENISNLVQIILNAPTIGQIFGFILTLIGIFLIALNLYTNNRIKYDEVSSEMTDYSNNNITVRSVKQPLMNQ